MKINIFSSENFETLCHVYMEPISMTHILIAPALTSFTLLGLKSGI